MAELEGLRVCILAGNLQQGGAERQLFYVLHALRDSGTQTDVLCLTKGETWEAPFEEAGFPVTWVGQSPVRARRLAAIVSRLRKRPADIVQSQHFFANSYAAGAARLTGARDIGAIRGNGFRELGQGRLQAPLNMRLPRLIAVNSQAAIENVTGRGYPRAKFHLFPNTVDTGQFTPVARAPGPVTVLSVGRLIPEKRFDLFLPALAEVATTAEVEVTGLIVGGRRDDVLEPELRRQAGELDLLPDGLQFGGAVSDMAPVYADADVFVLTSEREGTPNVVLEAMAAGLPVVSTRVGDAPAIVQDGVTGFLVDDERGLADALRRLVADEGLRTEMGERGRRWVEANRSPAQLPGLLAELYGKALA